MKQSKPSYNLTTLMMLGFAGTVVSLSAGTALGQASFQGLGDLPGGTLSSEAFATSADGAVVVGLANPAVGIEAFRWTSDGGMVGLGDLPGTSFFSIAFATSADGAVIVGNSSSTSGPEAFLWTSSGGLVGLGDLPGGSFTSRAFGTSADGAVVVGDSSSASGTEAFRWTSGGGMVGLGDLPGGNFSSTAFGTSADGSVVVGQGLIQGGFGINPRRAFIWDELNGMRSVQELLASDLGLDLTGWQLTIANGVSADGLTIVGRGVSPNSGTEAWTARLHPCPLPCVWDIDGSGDVRVPDLIKLLSCWGPLTGDPDCACLDIDSSDDIRVPDLIAMLAKWGVCS